MVNRQPSMVKREKAGNRFATEISYVLIHTYVSEWAVRSLYYIGFQLQSS
ncbi:MAG: hypothetical protein V7K96_07945 [Nostoc sp.]